MDHESNKEPKIDACHLELAENGGWMVYSSSPKTGSRNVVLAACSNLTDLTNWLMNNLDSETT